MNRGGGIRWLRPPSGSATDISTYTYSNNVPASMRLLQWLRCKVEELGYAAGNPPEDYGQTTGGCSYPLIIAADLLLYHAVQQAINDGIYI